MIKAVLKNGVIQPMEPLPSQWEDGQELLIEEQEAKASPMAEDLAKWEREMQEGVDSIPADEHERFRAALAEIERESKEQVRREWGLQ